MTNMAMLNERFPTSTMYGYAKTFNMLTQFSHGVHVKRPKNLMQMLVQYIDKYGLCISRT